MTKKSAEDLEARAQNREAVAKQRREARGHEAGDAEATRKQAVRSSATARRTRANEQADRERLGQAAAAAKGGAEALSGGAQQ